MNTYNNNNHRRVQSGSDYQTILYSRINELVDENSNKKLLQKNGIHGSALFQISEQNDQISSIEQTITSSQKTTFNPEMSSDKKNYSLDNKEFLRNSQSIPNLLSQIQYLVKGNHNAQIKPIQSERKDQTHKLSFTNELKKNSKIKQQINHNNYTYSQKKQNKIDEITKFQTKNSLLNNLLKNDQKKQYSLEKYETIKRMEFQMQRIENDIQIIKQRQDQLDEFNRSVQNQLFYFINENKKQQDYGYQSLKKLEQLEQITKRNEESIQFLKNSLLQNQRIGNENIKNINNQVFNPQKKILDIKQQKNSLLF